MFRRWLLPLCFSLLASSAQAQQTPPPGVDMSPPKSIWDIDSDGTATNPQSQLQCPPVLAGFQRNGLQAYNPIGSDVSCGYRGPAGEITVYLARYTKQPTPQQYFDSAKQAIVQRVPDAVPRTDVPAGPAGLEWIAGGYSEQGGKLNSDLWTASLSDWTAQIRATYTPAGISAVKDFMTAYSAVLTKTAAPHLAACAASTLPARAGVKVDGAIKSLLPLVVEGAATSIAPIPVSQANENWCAERSLSLGGKPYLYWRNIAADADRNTDRFVPMGEGIRLAVIFDTGGKAMADKTAPGTIKGDVYDLVEQSGPTAALVAVFDGRPSFETIAALISQPHDVYATIDPASKKISISEKAFKTP